MKKELDPLEEILANKAEIRREFPTLAAYREHLKTVPSAKEILRQLRAKQQAAANAPETGKAKIKTVRKKSPASTKA